MITLGVISVLVSIAIPAYQDYLEEAALNAARANVEPLHLALEDYRMDNPATGYTDFNGLVWIPGGAQTLDAPPINWRPDGDSQQFSYRTEGTVNTWAVVVQSIATPGNWARCEKNNGCCFSDTPGANMAACP